MNRHEIVSLCRAEEAAGFEGWDFSHLKGRMETEREPWDYAEWVKAQFANAHTLLDMGTGGGEVLSSLAPLPAQTTATEGYPPNVPVAQRRLAPLGVPVVAIQTNEHLPFADRQFNLIINRHEDYFPNELLRVLTPGGQFITQQVGGTDCGELNDHLGIPNSLNMPYWFLDYAVNQLEQAGFSIQRAQEAFPITRFYDVGAIAYYAKIIEWQYADFSVDRCADALVGIHRHIEKHGHLAVRSHRFIVHAVAP